MSTPTKAAATIEGNRTALGARLRVLVVDDHFVARYGVRKLLELQPDLEIVGEAKGGVEAVARYREHRPDLVLMDLRMEGFDGISATAAILRENPQARVLMVSSYDAETDVERARAAGALGFIAKESGPKHLLEGIRAVGRGETFMPFAPDAAGANSEDKLTARDLQLLRLLVDGLSNKEIAEKTALTLGTVKVYVCHLFDKMQVKNRSQAIVEAVKRGIVR